MDTQKYARLRVQIPRPGRDDGASVIDMDTGIELSCTDIRVDISSRTMLPTMTITMADGASLAGLEMAGTFRFEMIKEEPTRDG